MSTLTKGRRYNDLAISTIARANRDYLLSDAQDGAHVSSAADQAFEQDDGENDPNRWHVEQGGFRRQDHRVRTLLKPIETAHTFQIVSITEECIALEELEQSREKRSIPNLGQQTWKNVSNQMLLIRMRLAVERDTNTPSW